MRDDRDHLNNALCLNRIWAFHLVDNFDQLFDQNQIERASLDDQAVEPGVSRNRVVTRRYATSTTQQISSTIATKQSAEPAAEHCARHAAKQITPATTGTCTAAQDRFKQLFRSGGLDVREIDDNRFASRQQLLIGNQSQQVVKLRQCFWIIR